MRSSGIHRRVSGEQVRAPLCTLARSWGLARLQQLSFTSSCMKGAGCGGSGTGGAQELFTLNSTGFVERSMLSSAMPLFNCNISLQQCLSRVPKYTYQHFCGSPINMLHLALFCSGKVKGHIALHNHCTQLLFVKK